MNSNLKISQCEESDRQTITRLMQAYLAELSQFVQIRQFANGDYDYPYLSSYWQTPDRIPFLIYWANQPCGFALIRQEIIADIGLPGWQMAEFYVTPNLRREGIGRRVAHQIWQDYPGRWDLQVLEKNLKAYRFWQETINNAFPDVLNEHFANGFHQFSFVVKKSLTPGNLD